MHTEPSNYFYKGNQVLVVDGNESDAQALTEYMNGHGWLASQAHSGSDALSLLQKSSFDLVFINLQLPDIDGQRLCRDLRSFSTAGVIITSTCNDDIERIVSYESGADAFFCKPLSMREIHACSKNILSRMKKSSPAPTPQITPEANCYHYDNWSYNVDAMKIMTSAGGETSLTRNESRVLSALVDASEKVLSREALLKQLGNREWSYYDRTIDVLITRLRSKLTSLDIHKGHLVTHYGNGYMFTQTLKTL
ncbi:MAG: response regulator transcription factor [Halopseudomonas sp.]